MTRIRKPNRQLFSRHLTKTTMLACGAALALALSGCAVGPDFAASAAPDVNGYTPETLAETDQFRRMSPGARRSVSCRTSTSQANGGRCSIQRL